VSATARRYGAVTDSRRCDFPAGILVSYRRDIVRYIWHAEGLGPDSLPSLRARQEELVTLDAFRHAHKAVGGCTCWRDAPLPEGEDERAPQVAK
jgi:hypothetical protein